MPTEALGRRGRASTLSSSVATPFPTPCSALRDRQEDVVPLLVFLVGLEDASELRLREELLGREGIRVLRGLVQLVRVPLVTLVHGLLRVLLDQLLHALDRRHVEHPLGDLPG